MAATAMAAWSSTPLSFPAPGHEDRTLPSRSVYDLLYRVGAARWKRGWDRGVGPELRALIDRGTLTPTDGARAIDLGCGSGDNTLFLAERGFDALGVDFSAAAIHQAKEKAAAAVIDRARFQVADITNPIAGVRDPFDLVLVYNVIQDLRGDARQRLADVASSLTREGSRIVLWCWYAEVRRLPPVSYRGPSRIAPFVVEPGEERRLFGDAFEYERPDPQPAGNKALFVLTRRATPSRRREEAF
jgi:SAM-dependent methyltransferase